MRIAIVKLSSMGDIVHAMVVLQFIKRIRPDIAIDWFVEERFSELLQYNPHIDCIISVQLKTYKNKPFRLIDELRRLREQGKTKAYDMVIDMQGLIKSAVVSKILGKKIVGFDKDSIRESFAARFYTDFVACDYDANAIWRNAVLVSEALGLKIEPSMITDKEPFIFYGSKKKFFDTNSLKKNIVYGLGASKANKRIPPSLIVSVIKSLPQFRHFLLWHGNEESAIADRIASETEATKLPVLTIDEMKALFDQADLVVGADSGPTHVAWGLNRPTLTIFGPTPSYRNAWYGKRHQIIDCGYNRLFGSNGCIRHIAPERVASVILELV